MKRLALPQYVEAAQSLGCRPEVVYAVAQVESGGRGGFLPEPDGRIIVRLENHWFWKNWGKQNPETFAKHFRFGGQGVKAFQRHQVNFGDGFRMQHVGNLELEWRAFDLACSLNQEAALLSTSYGMFQPMGFNHKPCGYDSVEIMFADLQESEANQLKAFIAFCRAQSSRFENAIKTEDFATIERIYNGGGQNGKYAKQMKAAFDKAVKSNLFSTV